MLASLGSRCAAAPLVVFVLWAALLAGSLLANTFMGGDYSDNFNVSGTPPAVGGAVLSAHFPSKAGNPSQIVLNLPSAPLTSKRQPVEKAIQQLTGLPKVLGASDPFTTQGALSANGHTAYTTVRFSQQPASIAGDEISVVERAMRPATDAGVGVYYADALGRLARPSPTDKQSELIGFAVALIVLLAGFGSVAGALIPLSDALIAVICSISLLGLSALAVNFATVAPTLATMIGLGVGIDYTLFLTTRFRQRVSDGTDPEVAAAETLATSGRSVLIAGCTVIVALVGLYASGLTFIGNLGLAAALAVATAAASALTLAPAVLGFLGRRIDRLHVRRPVAESGADDDDWHRYARSVERHPWRYLTLGLVIVGVLATPVPSMHLSHIDGGAEPTNYSERQAYDLISSAFGQGANGPFTVAIRLAANNDATKVAGSVQQGLASLADVASMSPLTTSPDGAVLVGTLVPNSSPQSQATLQLYHQAQNVALPRALAGTGATGYLTGATAGQLAFRDLVVSRLWIIILFVILIAFFLLLVSFRAPVLAFKAALLNLLSIGAAYGVIVAVFQWGWLRPIIGVAQNVPIEAYVPMMMFAITFGLAMDYEVFLLSRVREAYDRLGDNASSVATGLSRTARVISCAALIMASVFLAFVGSGNVVVKMLGVGLAASVLIDATVIRLVLVPATMTLLGSANWWIPNWLDRVLPHLDPEGAQVALRPAPQRPSQPDVLELNERRPGPAPE